MVTGWRQRKKSLVSSFWVKNTALASQPCLTLYNPMRCSLPGFSVHGILPTSAREWVASPFPRGSSQPRNPTWVSCIGRWILYSLSPQGSPSSGDQAWASCPGNAESQPRDRGEVSPMKLSLESTGRGRVGQAPGCRRLPGVSSSGSSFSRGPCSFSPSKICDSYTNLGFGKAQGRSSQSLAKLT